MIDKLGDAEAALDTEPASVGRILLLRAYTDDGIANYTEQNAATHTAIRTYRTHLCEWRQSISGDQRSYRAASDALTTGFAIRIQ
ncbi:unnamed protein product [marine sediment metagenome]|uniref:Uncharacterized protein n=1 Tax=marine sediment metagenome TaxID=412755 RepID=X0SSH3_9ZZZZ